MNLKNIWNNVNHLGLNKLEEIRPKEHKKPMANVNGFYLLGGAYAVYIAYYMFKGALSGEAGGGRATAVGIAASVVLFAAGCWILWRQYKAYRYGKEHIDDPSTWSDEAAEEALSALEAEAKELEAPEEINESEASETEAAPEEAGSDLPDADGEEEKPS